MNSLCNKQYQKGFNIGTIIPTVKYSSWTNFIWEIEGQVADTIYNQIVLMAHNKLGCNNFYIKIKLMHLRPLEI